MALESDVFHGDCRPKSSRVDVARLLESEKLKVARAPSFFGGADFFVDAMHTLGPENTSSHIAAQALSHNICENIEIKLYPQFEMILDSIASLKSGNLGAHLALVPSAYAGIDRFFMSQHTRLVGCFCFDTPPYHLAWSASQIDPLAPNATIRVATHPAPITLLPQLVPAGVRYEISSCPSTVAAANAALVGEADVALCNLETIHAQHMAHHPKGIAIAMTWNLFLLGVDEASSNERSPEADAAA